MHLPKTGIEEKNETKQKQRPLFYKRRENVAFTYVYLPCSGKNIHWTILIDSYDLIKTQIQPNNFC